MPRMNRAALDGNREAAQEDQQRIEIVADTEGARKHYGACIGCGIRIAPSSTTLRCATCAAWRRWFSAHRIASRALRGATR